MLIKDKEKLFMYCLEELRLLIEKPYMSDALSNRLENIKNNLELLYKHELMKVR